MKPSLTALLVAMLFASNLTAQAAPRDAAADKQAIKKTYEQLEAAMRAKNLKAIAALETADFTHKSGGKTYTAKQALDEMAKHLRSMKRIGELKVTARTIALKGAQATVLSDYALSAVIVDGGRPHDLKVLGSSKDTLIKKHEGWKFQKVVELTNSSTMDGQAPPINPPSVRASQTSGGGGRRR
jgi:ketosteroid isomerase-like protein